MNFPDAVMSIIAANGNRMVGKTRLQKSAYFLERMNLGFGFDFDYHYYGPYSEELSIASEDAKALGLIKVDWETSNSGMEYAVYSSGEPSDGRGEQFEMRQEVLSLLGRYDATSLELAATADFLLQNGISGDPWAETQRRKAPKATEERLEKAKRLTRELDSLRVRLAS